MHCEYPQGQASASASPGSTTSSSYVQEIAPESTSSTYDVESDFNDTNSQISAWLLPPAIAATGQLSFVDHELLHHYKTLTWKIFAVREDAVIQTLHRDFVPQSSLSHSFLLYALLGIAASHSNMLYPRKEVEKQALVYKQKTFQEYSKALQNITADNYEMILMTSTFLLALIPPPVHEGSDEDYLQWMYSILKLSEGLRVLASLRWSQGIEKMSIYPLFCRELRTLPPPPFSPSRSDMALCTLLGPLGTTPDHPNPAPTYQEKLPSSNPIFLPPALMDLLTSISNPSDTGPIETDRQALVPAFHALSPIFLSLYYYHLNQDFYVRVFVYTSFLMPDFMQLVKTREPRALTIVAWWFALANLVPRGWWIGRCLTGVIEAFKPIVSEHYLAAKAFEGVENMVRVLRNQGSVDATRSIFEGWIDWDEGPRKAEEWELAQLVDVSGIDEVELDLTEFIA